MEANQGVKQITFEAVVIRANGTVEDLGTVAQWEEPSPPEDPARRLLQRVRNAIPQKEPNVALSDERGQHAQHLFDRWSPQSALPALYEYLSRNNIDANQEPHSWIRIHVETAAELGDPLATRALGKKG